MLLFLSKLIQMLFYPVGLSIALAIAGGIFLVLQKKKTAIILVFFVDWRTDCFLMSFGGAYHCKKS